MQNDSFFRAKYEKVPIKDSQTSDQPPSWDHFKKPRTRSQREFTSRKPGGQVGHHGQTLNPVSNPGMLGRPKMGLFCLKGTSSMALWFLERL